MDVKVNMDIKKDILLVYKGIADDSNHRYRSWEHCYKYFREKRPFNDETEDIATLQLAFYLASWGMYRGSSQLLQKDYLVHLAIVKEITNSKYESLWDLDVGKLNEKSPEINLLFDLIEQLRKLYKNIHVSPDKYVSPTDTLITKVLLGTLGCVPAYDRFFTDGVREWKNHPEYTPKFPIYLSKKSYIGLVDFYKQHKDSINEAQKEIGNQGIEYPTMKLVDMYFWQLGWSE